MSDDDSTWPTDVRELQELFVDVTDTQTFTDVQDEEKGRGVVHATSHGEPARPEDVESDPHETVQGPLVDTRPGAVDDTIDSRPDQVDR